MAISAPEEEEESQILDTSGLSETAKQLSRVTPEMARATLQRATDGYRSRGGEVIPPAQSNLSGCVLSSKVKTRPDDTGYTQMAPVGLPVPDGKQKNIGQGLHRLAVVAYGSAGEVRRMLHGQHASHLCHNPACFAAGHIVVEPKEANEDRKNCKARVVVTFVLQGVRYELPPSAACTHTPPCIAQRVDGGVPVAVGTE